MYIFFEILKGIFFFLTVIIGLFFLKGSVIFSAEHYLIFKQIMMPGYLLFCGLMLGYILANLRVGTDIEEPKSHKIYIKSFIIGITIGLLLAVTYIFI